MISIADSNSEEGNPTQNVVIQTFKCYPKIEINDPPESWIILGRTSGQVVKNTRRKSTKFIQWVDT